MYCGRSWAAYLSTVYYHPARARGPAGFCGSACVGVSAGVSHDMDPLKLTVLLSFKSPSESVNGYWRRRGHIVVDVLPVNLVEGFPP